MVDFASARRLSAGVPVMPVVGCRMCIQCARGSFVYNTAITLTVARSCVRLLFLQKETKSFVNSTNERLVCRDDVLHCCLYFQLVFPPTLAVAPVLFLPCYNSLHSLLQRVTQALCEWCRRRWSQPSLRCLLLLRNVTISRSVWSVQWRCGTLLRHRITTTDFAEMLQGNQISDGLFGLLLPSFYPTYSRIIWCSYRPSV